MTMYSFQLKINKFCTHTKQNNVSSEINPKYTKLAVIEQNKT